MGGSAPKAPDYTPMANASKESAEIMAKLGREQLDFAKQQYEDANPYLQEIAQQQIDISDEQLRQAREYYDYQQETFRPVEERIVSDAMDFNTDAYREKLAQQAAADAGMAFGLTRGANERAMASMGVNPNSGRFEGINAASNLGLSASKAAAMTGARTSAEQLGQARLMDAAGLGRNLSGASLAAYGGATSAGSSAGQNLQSAGQNYMGNMAIGSGTIASGQQMRLNGLGAILNSQTSAYINGGGGTGFGEIAGGLGALAGAGAKIYTASDRRLKENIIPVGKDEHTGLTLYQFNYKSEPGRTFIGVMADEVEPVFPDAVIETISGFKAVNYGALGLEMKEIV